MEKLADKLYDIFIDDELLLSLMQLMHIRYFKEGLTDDQLDAVRREILFRNWFMAVPKIGGGFEYIRAEQIINPHINKEGDTT